MTADEATERRLKSAQRNYVKWTEERREAVLHAFRAPENLTDEGEHRWTAYRIAKAMGVPESVVRGIIVAANRRT